jgi:hypothetical protein
LLHIENNPEADVRFVKMPEVIDRSSGEEDSIQLLEHATRNMRTRKKTKPFEFMDKEKIQREERKRLKRGKK